MKTKIVSNNTETLIDKETGEVLSMNTKQVKLLLDKTKFALVYTTMWDALIGADLSKSDIELFSYLVSNYGDGTIFTINSYIKEEISKKSGKKVSSYNNSTRKLLSKELILRKSKKNYIINPVYAFQGSSNTRKKIVLELIETGEVVLGQ